jgi:hypothetical protein
MYYKYIHKFIMDILKEIEKCLCFDRINILILSLQHDHICICLCIYPVEIKPGLLQNPLFIDYCPI